MLLPFSYIDRLVATLLEQDIRTISEWKEVMVEKLNIQPDHVHVVESVPPKVSFSDYIGILKGKTAIKLFKNYPKLKKKCYESSPF